MQELAVAARARFAVNTYSCRVLSSERLPAPCSNVGLKSDLAESLKRTSLQSSASHAVETSSASGTRLRMPAPSCCAVPSGLVQSPGWCGAPSRARTRLPCPGSRSCKTVTEASNASRSANLMQNSSIAVRATESP
eukprot:scaffold54755_cov32-Tisochrysis_lutea.AAC.6